MSDWFAIVDAARDSRLHALVTKSTQYRSLFDEPLDKDLVPVAPYLVHLNEAEPLLPTWRKHGRGKAWGVMVESDAGFDVLRGHFRKFLKARMPDGALVMFRFYDPRVLGPYLLTSPAADLAQWFDKLRQFIVEGEDGRQHSYRWRRGQLFDGDLPVGQEGTDREAAHVEG